jgi:hypothetical protein
MSGGRCRNIERHGGPVGSQTCRLKKRGRGACVSRHGSCSSEVIGLCNLCSWRPCHGTPCRRPRRSGPGSGMPAHRAGGVWSSTAQSAVQVQVGRKTFKGPWQCQPVTWRLVSFSVDLSPCRRPHSAADVPYSDDPMRLFERGSWFPSAAMLRSAIRRPGSLSLARAAP